MASEVPSSKSSIVDKIESCILPSTEVIPGLQMILFQWNDPTAQTIVTLFAEFINAYGEISNVDFGDIQRLQGFQGEHFLGILSAVETEIKESEEISEENIIKQFSEVLSKMVDLEEQDYTHVDKRVFHLFKICLSVELPEYEIFPPQKQEKSSQSSKPKRRKSQLNAHLYKTELCRSFQENGYCRYGAKCKFAHGVVELRTIVRSSKYKTVKCRNFEKDGSCPYGSRCQFIHYEDQQLP